MQAIIIEHANVNVVGKYVQENHCWCELTPLPDLLWEATFKDEGHVEKLSALLGGHVTPALKG